MHVCLRMVEYNCHLPNENYLNLSLYLTRRFPKLLKDNWNEPVSWCWPNQPMWAQL